MSDDKPKDPKDAPKCEECGLQLPFHSATCSKAGRGGV